MRRVRPTIFAQTSGHKANFRIESKPDLSALIAPRPRLVESGKHCAREIGRFIEAG